MNMIIRVPQSEGSKEALLGRIEHEMERRQMYEELRVLKENLGSEEMQQRIRKTKRNKRVMEEFDPRKQQEESAKRFGRIGGSIIMGKRR
ncbi:unnamed protein product, partial [Mesorhabditis spiculigera]